MSIYHLDVKTISGEIQSLSHYQGKALLIVNVASKCGLTPQYAQLESLYVAQRDHGLVVLGFPSNEFAGQEPGSDEDIQSFCQLNFAVDFPMFSKIEVNGNNRHPLYNQLISAHPDRISSPDSDFQSKLAGYGLLDGKSESDILWNFEKFLVNRQGEVTGRYSPDMTVQDEPLSGDIKRLLQD